MGKPEKPAPQPVTIVSSKERGMKIDTSEITWGFVVGFLALVAFVVWVVWKEFGDHTPQYHAPQPLSPILIALAIAIGVLLAIALLVGLVAAGIHLYLAYRKRMAEVTQAERDAELIRAEGNGLFPWRRAPDGTLQNLNAVPGPRVEPNGEMRDPETSAQREAVQRGAVIQIAAGGHGRLPMPDLVPLAPREMPPVQVIEGERLEDVNRRLLEAGREEV
jgi:hypothetical protein